MTKPKGGSAVMQQRIEPLDSLDDFPTPPWATRALFEIVFRELGLDFSQTMVWEPACGRGLMAFVIEEYARECFASDVHDYGYGEVGSFTGQGPDVIDTPKDVGAVFTNPPFALAQQFLERGLEEAPVVAMLLRTSWVEGISRYNDVFAKVPPTTIAFFVERVPMHRGRWEPEGSTATSYSWFVWCKYRSRRPPLWIPPGLRISLHRPDDRKRAYELGALAKNEWPLL